MIRGYSLGRRVARTCGILWELSWASLLLLSFLIQKEPTGSAGTLLFSMDLFPSSALHQKSRCCHSNVKHPINQPLRKLIIINQRIFISLSIKQIPTTVDRRAKPVWMWCCPCFPLDRDGKSLCFTDPSKTFVAFQGRKRDHNNALALVSVLDKFSCCENK